jgi:Ca-activated chloride channel family protein
MYTVGVGVEGRAPVPVPNAWGGTTMQYIDSDVDVPLLKKIAEIGQGSFFRATDGDSLQRIFKEIDQLEKTSVELTESREHHDLFPWFVMAGAACVLLHAIFGSAWQGRLP